MNHPFVGRACRKAGHSTPKLLAVSSLVGVSIMNLTPLAASFGMAESPKVQIVCTHIDANV